MPGASFVGLLGFPRLDFAPLPNAIWSTLVPFDSESDSFELNSRVRWSLNSGQAMNFLLDCMWQRNSGVVSTESRAVVLKLQQAPQLECEPRLRIRLACSSLLVEVVRIAPGVATRP